MQANEQWGHTGPRLSDAPSVPFVTRLFSTRYWVALDMNRSSEPAFSPGKYGEALRIPNISSLISLRCWGSVLEDGSERSQ